MSTTEAHEHPPVGLGRADVSRRAVLQGAGAASLGVVTVGVLAACSTGGGPTSSTGKAPGAAASSGVLAKVADIPVGGALAATGADGAPLILSQPTAGTIVAMSAVCTHRGCTVAPDGARLVCPCHGSVFAAADGATVSGPATTPLPSVPVHVTNGEVLAG